LTSVNPRNQQCLALIAAHALAWQFNENGHEQLREQISDFVEPGLYHCIEPTLQPILVEVIDSTWEPGAGKNAFKVGYVVLGGSGEIIIESVADFLAKFQPDAISEPTTLTVVPVGTDPAAGTVLLH
jgi:hypothetical protein